MLENVCHRNRQASIALIVPERQVVFATMNNIVAILFLAVISLAMLTNVEAAAVTELSTSTTSYPLDFLSELSQLFAPLLDGPITALTLAQTFAKVFEFLLFSGLLL